MILTQEKYCLNTYLLPNTYFAREMVANLKIKGIFVTVLSQMICHHVTSSQWDLQSLAQSSFNWRKKQQKLLKYSIQWHVFVVFQSFLHFYLRKSVFIYVILFVCRGGVPWPHPTALNIWWGTGLLQSSRGRACYNRTVVLGMEWGVGPLQPWLAVWWQRALSHHKPQGTLWRAPGWRQNPLPFQQPNGLPRAIQPSWCLLFQRYVFWGPKKT